MSQEKKNNFAQLKSERARRLVSSAVHDSRVKVTLWTSGQNLSLESRVIACIEKGNEFVVSIRTETAEKVFLQALASSGIREVFFSMNLVTDILFFRAELREPEPPFSGAFRVLEPIYMVERRADLRVRIPATEKLSVEFEAGSERLAGSILDLSASGMSMLLSTSSASIAQETLLKNLRFRFRDLEFTTDATVRHVANATQEARGPRLGILFKNLSPRSHDALYRAIVEQSMKYAHR